MGGATLAASEVQWSMLWFVLFIMVIIGLALFVIALVRWEMNSWKYVLLVGFLVPFIPAAAGWIALFAGGTKRRTAGPVLPPPPGRQ